MKVYWDTSAIIWYFGRGRIGEIRGVTRPHTLSETFSALQLWTIDENDFVGLGKVPLKYLADTPVA
jgi:hypothetical protein